MATNNPHKNNPHRMFRRTLAGLYEPPHVLGRLMQTSMIADALLKREMLKSFTVAKELHAGAAVNDVIDEK